jgi:5-methylthioadenosine/S-adenosylhomocysteine deaminase
LILPVSSRPIEAGALLIDETGRIVEVGRDTEVPDPESADRVRLTDAVILPGLVNLHTHLELTGLRDRIPQTDFFSWLQQVRAAKDATSQAGFLAAARTGVRDCWRHGTTTVADTGTSGAAALALSEMGGRGLYYHEAIAPDPVLCEATFAAYTESVSELLGVTAAWVTVGVSPHAPYTVSPQLYALVLDFARSSGLPIAAHLAESQAESDLVMHGRGPFARAWRERGIPAPVLARSPVEYAQRLGMLAPDFLAIHAVRTDARDIELLAARDVAVAVCVRSNRVHGHGSPPLGEFLAAGLRLGLGTDSVASVASPDLLAEARAARQLCGLSATATLELLTLGGAAALGLDADIGSLEPGKWADLCVMRIDASDPPSEEALARAVLNAAPGAIIATYVAGRLVHGRTDQPGAEPLETST